MQGQDKGLVTWQGRPLAAWALDSLCHAGPHAPKDAGPLRLRAIGITANRNADAYRELLRQARVVTQGCVPLAVPGGVVPDDPDLPERSGPMAGIVTALRHSSTDWVLVLPCDTPRLPAALLPRLLAAAEAQGAEVAVPMTGPGTDGGETRHHWVCALFHKGVTSDLTEAFVKGERKIGRWIQARPWASVCFAPETDFQNMNTLETLHGRE